MQDIRQETLNECTRAEQSACVVLWEIDLTEVGGERYFFCNDQNEKGEPVTWQGRQYQAYPIQGSGFELNGKGTSTRPTLTVSNLYGMVTGMVEDLQSLVGGTVVRRKVYARFLDAVNFVNGNSDADPEQEVISRWRIEQCSELSAVSASFVLSTPTETDGAVFPGRIMLANTCTWTYRGDECGYHGPAVADEYDQPTTDITKDKCSKCHFGVLSLGAVAAPSTSIENGFEYHFDEFKKALEEYVKCRNKELELMRQTEDEADRAGNAFDQAIKALSGERPRIAPPGRNGVVAFAVSGTISSPDELNSSFNTAVRLGGRGAISAAVLAPDEATAQNNVLSRFFSTLKERSGGVAGVLDGVMDVWGRLLVGYGDIQGSADELMGEMIKGLGGGSGALGSIASWLGDTVSASVAALGLEPCDLRLRKPVLTDSANVIKSPGSDIAGLSQAQDKLRSIPLGVTDPKALCEALEYQVERTISGTVFTLAEIPLPGGGSIPLTVDVATLVGALGGGS